MADSESEEVLGALEFRHGTGAADRDRLPAEEKACRPPPATGARRSVPGSRPLYAAYSCPMARPRQFDEEEAVRAARDQFWTVGFHGTSIDDLSAATGLGRGSLYAAFGGKRALLSTTFRLCSGSPNRVR